VHEPLCPDWLARLQLTCCMVLGSYIIFSGAAEALGYEGGWPGAAGVVVGLLVSLRTIYFLKRGNDD
jgi:hypothetical protein